VAHPCSLGRSFNTSMPRKQMSLKAAQEFGLTLPDVREGVMHGNPALKVLGHLMMCPAIHSSAEPDSIVVSIDPGRRQELLEARPDVFYVTEHYREYPTVLVRLAQMSRKQLQDLLMDAWHFTRSKARAKRPKWERIRGTDRA
jgi:hypothetical protein